MVYSVDVPNEEFNSHLDRFEVEMDLFAGSDHVEFQSFSSSTIAPYIDLGEITLCMFRSISHPMFTSILK